MRSRWLLLIVVFIAACRGGTDGSDPVPVWVGSFALHADSALSCHEEEGPGVPRHCVCDPPGHYEGTLTLAVTDSGTPTGTLKFRSCLPGSACGSEVTVPVTTYSSPTPPGGPFPWMTSPDTLNFCANGCPFSGNGGWSFVRAGAPWDSLTGSHWRADGNSRGCGSDVGPFKAVRQ